MIADRLLSQTATVIDTAEELDDAGNVVRDEFGNVQRTEKPRAVRFWHEQIGADEAPPVTEQTHTGFFPAGDPITEFSKVIFDDLTFQVIGPPSRPVNPRTGEPWPVSCALKRTGG